jgi:hypothetical protein
VAGSGTPPPALDPRSAGRRRASDAVAGDDDLGDIEAILRKHGIS